MSSETLAIWRQHGKGPCFIQVGRLIRYPVAEVESFERNLKFGPSRGISIPATAFMQTTDKKIGRLRRPEFSERKSQAIIEAYLCHLFDRRPTGCQIAAINEFSRLMAPKITIRDSDEIEIADGTERLTPEVLFVDLINNLEKLSALVKEVLNQACSKSAQLNRHALLQAVDQYGDMSTRRRIFSLHQQGNKSAHGRRPNWRP
nr:hypothetical protein [uncultured Limnohabitans sp.]